MRIKLVAIGLLIVIAGCAETPTPAPAESVAPPPPKYRVVAQPTCEFTPFFGYSLSGDIQNVSSETARGYVSCRFYDDAGRLVGTGSDSIWDWPPGETWHYEISVPASAVTWRWNEPSVW